MTQARRRHRLIPDSVFGLLLLAASLGPGYMYVRIAERRNPRPNRSALLETAELITVGGSCSAVAFVVAAVLARWTDMVDLVALEQDAAVYTVAHPARVFLLLLVGLGGAYLLAWIAARAIYRGVPASLFHHSVWHELLRAQAGGRPYVTVELRDGRTVAGPVAYYTVQEAPPDSRELVLIKPIRARAASGMPYVPVVDDRIALRASDITALSVQYF